ncbi:MAG: PEP-CTERM sorting domain-containing protein [Verrucomicrobiota bacterium]|nr:PEP-CTERM sorting domain-containing protein [Verrucomicrobiota bacterium]
MIKHILFALIIVLTGSGRARADFTDYYSFPSNSGPNFFYYQALVNGPYTFMANNWSIVSNEHATFGGIAYPYVSATGSQLVVDSGTPLVFPGVPASGRLEVSSVAPSAGFLSFDFTLSLSPFTSNGYREAYYFVNGSRFMLAQGSGSMSGVLLNPGDSFGFGVNMGAFVSNTYVNANLTVTNFSAPVPEPHSLALLLFGVGLFVICFRRKVHLL